MKLTTQNSKATFIQNGKYLLVDGKLEKQSDLDAEHLEIMFVFDKTSKNLDKLKEKAVGGNLVPMANLTIDDVLFDVIAMGAVDDKPTEISLFMYRSKQQ